MTIRQAMKMIDFHRRAEKAYRATGQEEKAETAKRMAMELENKIANTLFSRKAR